MRACVVGLGHLGGVTAAGLASVGHAVVGFDPDAALVEHLRDGHPVVNEPGLADLVQTGLASGQLELNSDARVAMRGAEVVWVAFDSPIDEHDRPDVDWVIDRVEAIMPDLEAGAVVLVSSQVPVGTTRRLMERCNALHRDGSIAFAYSPENLRLGVALESFLEPSRVVVGTFDEGARERIRDLLAPITDRIEWMGVESAEMTKHVINAFLATSLALTNEVATIAERVGADARDVERALRSEPRIGARAYVSPGAAYAGGTLARDVSTLAALGRANGVETHLLDGVRASNDHHLGWALRTLEAELGDLTNQRIAVLGLTYKPGTSTLQRSAAVELCRTLRDAGAHVSTHDPAADALPPDLADVERCSTITGSLTGATALVIATPWPDFASITAEDVSAMSECPIVVDPTGLLLANVAGMPRVRYSAVGSPRS